ncbi:PrgI family protein, partial [Kibdelosporangium lantanae]
NRQRLRPRHHVAAPEGIRPVPDWLTVEEDSVSPAALRLPAEDVTDTGVIDLDSDGLAVVAVASTVNFQLRTPNEQESLVATFGRYLHSLTAPIQVLVRTERLDLSGQIIELRERAGGLPHPALESAALEHAAYLAQLAQQTDLLRRQVLLVLREPLGPTAPTDGLGGPSPWTVLTSLTR